jgi:LEA14-like dessication related protein
VAVLIFGWFDLGWSDLGRSGLHAAVNLAFRTMAMAAALVALAPGCFKHWVDFEVRRISAMHVHEIDARGFDVTVRSVIVNPNRVGATIRNIRFHALSGDHLVGQGHLAGPITVAANGQLEVEAPVRIAYADLPADLPARVQDGALPLTIRASLDAVTSIGTFHMDLEESGRVEIARALEVAVSGRFGGDALVVRRIALASVDTRSLGLQVQVELRNAFAFPVRIRQGQVALWVNDQHFGKTAFNDMIEIPPRQSITRTFDIAAAHKDVWATLQALLDSEPLFRARGTLWIEPIAGVSELPFDVTADMSVFDAD